MAAGSSGKASAGAMEAALERKLQSVSNTMESIQSLSGWCIDNKKQHVTIVHHWIQCFRRSGFPHRLNLFYLANDIIQNCKRKNAIVFREAFADVLPEAVSLVKDQSVAKNVERVIKIWEERNVYPEDTIITFKSALSGSWSKRDKSKSSRSKPERAPDDYATSRMRSRRYPGREKEAGDSGGRKHASRVPVANPKAALKSKIVAEFRPQGLIEDLMMYKRAVDHIDYKEKQLSSMRVDVCSTETLKRLKDKAGGKKFSKDFEEASAKLEEFVTILDKQVKSGPAITEALENAGIFYEAQFREVKVVVNAYKTFANRVNNLKKKLDQLKSTLPDPEESPMPSPTIDAPSPTGSESPFPGMGDESPLSPEVEPLSSNSPDPPKDNRMVEDMELSDVDADEDMPTIILEERNDQTEPSTSPHKDTAAVTSASTPSSDIATYSPSPVSAPTPATTPVTTPAPVTPSTVAPATSSVTTTPAKPVIAPVMTPVPLALPNLANVDLGKISSILSSLTSAMKSGVSPAAKLSPGTPTTPTSNLAGAIKTPVQTTPNPLANILSKVEFTPESILSVLSKTQVSTSNLQGLSSLIQSVAGSTSLSSGSTTVSTSTPSVSTAVQALKDRVTPSATPPFVSKNLVYSPPDPNPDASLTPVSKPSTPSSVAQAIGTVGLSTQPPVSAEKTKNKPPEMPKQPEETESSSLEMKIHNFLKGNPGFSGLDLNIPILSGLGSSSLPETSSEFHSGPPNTSLENTDGTPVRDERSGTPTQDEIMDKPASSNVDSVSLLSKIISSGSSTPSSSRSPLLNKESDYQKLPPMQSYRPFGLGGSSPNAYRQPSDVKENPSVVDSALDNFFSETSFHEDEDYREFDFTGPSSTLGNLERLQSKSILQGNMHLNSMEYTPVTQSYSQVPDYGRQPFPPPVHPPFMSGENSGQLSPPDRYGGYNVRGNKESASSSSPPKEDSLYPSDTNHNISLLHPNVPQNKYTDPTHVQNRHSNFLPKNNPPPVRPPAEQSVPSVNVSTTMEFKNMLKNASRRPEEPQFGQSSLDEDIRISGLGHARRSSDEQSEEQYRIETRVSASSLDLPDTTEEKGAPIETLGYHNVANIRMSGEPIKTVESMRVGVKGGRGHGMDGGRPEWFDMGSTEGSFDDGTPNADEQPSVSVGSNVGFKTQYDEHLARFPDSVSDFRANNIQPFEHRLQPPPMVPTLDLPLSFQMDQTGPPPVPPPVLPPDPGSLFGRDLPVATQMPPMEPPKTLSHVAHPPPTDHLNNPFSLHHTAEQGGIPFSPPPRLDMRNPFSQDLGPIPQGIMQEPYSMHSSSARDQGPMSHDYSNQHSQSHNRVNEAMGPNPRDHHGNYGSQQPTGSHHRDFMHTRGPRPQRPHFRPREPYHNLKRPRPPFGRGQQFFSPKRPYYQPRY